MREAINQVEVYGSKTELTSPFKGLLSHGLRLDAMHRLLNFGIKVLNTKRRAIKSGLVQSDHVITGEPARINFDSCLVIGAKSNLTMDNVTQLADFVRRKESGRAASPMKLHDFSARIQQGGDLRQFLLEVVYVSLPLVVIESNYGRATAEPAERFTKWNVEIK